VNEVLSIGLILMAALTAGHLAQLIRLPEVTGYLAIGMLIGPASLDLITHDNLTALGILSEVALGLILFNIGAIFEASTFRQLGPGVARITLWEASLAFVLVAASLLAVGVEWPLALLLGCVAMETAPATTLMVLNEYDAEGPMTERLLALVALNNTYVLIVFGVITAALTLLTPSPDTWLWTGYRALHGLGWTILGSIALGALVGVATDLWATRVKESGEAMILAAGVVLLTVGASRWLGVSPLIATLSLGAMVANGSRHGGQLLKALRRADPPIYAAFFVLAGAELVPGSVLTLGMAGVVYLAARAAGKVAGTRIALRSQDVPPLVRQQLGYCLISSSSLAVGLTIQIRSLFPQYAVTVGPLLLRRALVLTGEARTIPSPLDLAADTDSVSLPT
jgi:Kef-type K+ transport system membrane component KefB